ncbi:uncharacterized protein LOC143099196 isoform X1 [Alosa pseudoharengus]|uniref:uncharacterized protein LOC143099196 isoform X1 n=1 Tax=Alosa pseudoharengus TaxID=34774 RepID=UPI003F89A835
MKTGVTLTLFPLTMLSCVTCKDITVRGYEGGHAVFNCPVGVFTSSPKYLLKGDYDEIIRSDGNKEWTHRGRVSLKYKNNNNFFSVTIHKLTLKDAGTYWCGVDTWGPDLYYTKVNHEVGRHTSDPVPVGPKVTTRGTTANASSIPVATRVATSIQPSENTAGEPESTSESDHATNIQSDPTSGASAGLVYIGAGLAVVVFVLVLSLFMLYTQKTRSRKASAPPVGQKPNPSSGNTQQCDYAEVTISPGNHTSRHAHFSTDPSAIYSNVLPPSNQNPDSVDYSTVRFDGSEESLQYATVRFTDPPAGGDKQRSTSRDDAVIYSTINQDS